MSADSAKRIKRRARPITDDPGPFQEWAEALAQWAEGRGIKPAQLGMKPSKRHKP